MAVVKVGDSFYNTVTGRKITEHAALRAEIKRAGQVGIPSRDDTPIIAGRIQESARTPALATHKAAGISGGFIGHAEAPKAADGQSLASQSAQVIATYTSAHGDNAYQQWVVDHNREIGAGDVIDTTATDGDSVAGTETDTVTVATGNDALDEAIKSLNLAGGIEERKLDAKIAADAAQAAYLEKRLNFESEDAARRAGLDAARLAVESRSLNRQFGLDVGNFLMQARGPRNFGQLFNIYGGDPATESGLPRRLFNALTGAGPVGRTPNTAVPAGTQLGFAEQLKQIFGGGGQVSADEVLSRLINGPEQTTPQFGTDPATGRAGFNLDPRNINPVQFNRLQPSEKEAAVSLLESAGFPLLDVQNILEGNLPAARQLASPRLGSAGLRT